MTTFPPMSAGGGTATTSSTPVVDLLQAKLDKAQRSGEVAVLVRGDYELEGPLYLRGPARVIVEPGVVLRPRLLWDPGDAVIVATGEDLVLEGELEIDERGALRVLLNSVGQTFLCTNLDGFDFSRLLLRFRDTGVATAIDTLEEVRAELEAAYEDDLENLFDENAGPSGPDLLCVALDALGDFYDEGTYLGEIGPCRDGSFGRVEHIRGATTKRSFAIRCASNFDENRAFDAYANTCSDIRFERIDVRGSYEWNMVEALGTGTRAIDFGKVRAEGKTLTAVDFDKGCSRCSVDRVEVRNSGKPARYVGDDTTRFAAVDIHGAPADEENEWEDDQVTTDCKVGTVILRTATSASVDPYEAAVGCYMASNVQIGVIDAEDLNAGAYGCGLFVDSDVDLVHLGHLRTRGIKSAALVNGGVGCGDITIDSFDVEPEATTAFGFAPGAAGGRVATGALGAGVPLVSFGANLTSAQLGAAAIGGGGAAGQGVYCACDTTLVGPRIAGQNYGVVADGAIARCIGVDSSACVNDFTAINAGAIQVGNSWDDV
jgi:hypothetical protein